MTIQVDLYYSPYCPHCQAALDALAGSADAAAEGVRIDRRSVLEHLDAAVAAGVRSTPALVIDGRLVASGAVTERTLRRALANAGVGRRTR